MVEVLEEIDVAFELRIFVTEMAICIVVLMAIVDGISFSIIDKVLDKVALAKL